MKDRSSPCFVRTEGGSRLVVMSDRISSDLLFYTIPGRSEANCHTEGITRRVLWQNSESIAFLSSECKNRKDFHTDPHDFPESQPMPSDKHTVHQATKEKGRVYYCTKLSGAVRIGRGPSATYRVSWRPLSRHLPGPSAVSLEEIPRRYTDRNRAIRAAYEIRAYSFQ